MMNTSRTTASLQPVRNERHRSSMNPTTQPAVLIALALGSPGHQEPLSTAAEPVTAAEYGQLRAALTPPAQDWQRIPWRLDLLAARREALALGRPLFLWSMNGHPLGCT